MDDGCVEMVCKGTTTIWVWQDNGLTTTIATTKTFLVCEGIGVMCVDVCIKYIYILLEPDADANVHGMETTQYTLLEGV